MDEAQSRVTISHSETTGRKSYSHLGAELEFKEGVIGDAHVFRVAHMESAVICDRDFMDACKAAELKGIRFQDASKR